MKEYTFYLNYGKDVIEYADKLIKLNNTEFASLDDYLHYVLNVLINYDDPDTPIVLKHPDTVNETVLEKAQDLSLAEGPQGFPLRKERLKYILMLDKAENKTANLLNANTFWSIDLLMDYVIYHLVNTFSDITLPLDEFTRASISMWNSTRQLNALRDRALAKDNNHD